MKEEIIYAESTQINRVPTLNGASRVLESMPTPSALTYYRRQLHGANVAAPLGPIPVPIPIPIPLPVLVGPRILEWKQDPFVSEIAVRKAFLPGFVLAGPHDARITMSGPLSVAANAFGDFIQTPGTDPFDWVHTFSVVRQTLT